MKNQSEYHDLHVQTSRKKCTEIYKVDPIRILLAPGLVGHAV